MAGKQKRREQDYIQEITVADDGLIPVRKARAHSREKLAILAAYLPAFTTACGMAPRKYFVDGLAGPGLYRFDDGRVTRGSTLIALHTTPPFTRVLAMEKNSEAAQALDQRVARFAPGRAVVARGDCNLDLLPLMEQHLDRRAPLLVFLDPEGFEVEWTTVERLSRFREGGMRTELLMYFHAPAFQRFDVEGHHAGLMNVDAAMPPGANWRGELASLRQANVRGGPLVERMLGLYERGLRDLGYSHVEARPIGPSSPSDIRSRVRYYLVYATDFDPGAGKEGPMDWVFRNLWGASSDQPRLL